MARQFAVTPTCGSSGMSGKSNPLSENPSSGVAGGVSGSASGLVKSLNFAGGGAAAVAGLAGVSGSASVAGVVGMAGLLGGWGLLRDRCLGQRVDEERATW